MILGERNLRPAGGPATGAPSSESSSSAVMMSGPTGRLRPLGGDLADAIPRFDRLRPFLVNVVSDGDLWMYLSTAGALTAGRNNEDRALFPYETDDELHERAGVTGPLTALRVRRPDGTAATWRPFVGRAAGGVERTLAKTVLGNRVTFEERHDGLGLTFRYSWRACDAFGWVRTCELVSHAARRTSVDVLDGVVNLLPAGATLGLQRSGSCLINAHAQAELDVPSGLAIYSLASQITDRAEPAEALHANVAFVVGLPHARRWLTADQLDAWLDGAAVEDEHLVTGRRGALLASSRVDLDVGAARRWHVALDAHRTQAQVAALQALLNAESANALSARIDAALDAAGDRLRGIVANTDAQQCTADAIACAHHASNVLFNDLRGGAFLGNADVPAADFARNVRERSRAAAARHGAWLAALPATVPHGELVRRVAALNDPQLARLTMEYLPLTFGRRHGDPSRPWNRFDIRVTDDRGGPVLSYQGNWRDIFQNWEALALGNPSFVESMIAKFVNASTLDGFNPYRVTRAGVEWEVPDPNDPWAHIGYWGDHQIAYLLKLLEASRAAHGDAAGETLGGLLGERRFAYADVPYRLKPYALMLADRRETIEFDWPRHRATEARLAEVGTDARLVAGVDGEVLLVTLAEKLLVPALSKLAGFVPGGGIWMNTQRPEWNDANNALVGNGVSVVTLCHLRRYLAFCGALFASRGPEHFPERFEVRATVVDWLERTASTFAAASPAPGDARERRAMLDALGESFERYREATIDTRPAVAVEGSRVVGFVEAVLAHVDATIIDNRRRDGTYHAYNLLGATSEAIGLDRLPLMLEGQVAALSAGTLSPAGAADLVDRLFASPLWREDQRSFMLYPVAELPGFMGKNCVEEIEAMRTAFARRLLAAGERSILHRDPTGQVRFDASFRNAGDVRAALDRMADDPAWAAEVFAGGDEILALYERTFRHDAFTGRSGSMYGYEGVGCIYWHMVAKLLLAIQENVWRAVDEGAPADVRARLIDGYARVRAGLGFNKSAEAYGAFPLDAYSHTPLHAGAQQPGMTGQVKEEILTRFGELGVRRAGGIVRFAPVLLGVDEFLARPADWPILGLDGRPRTLRLDAGTLGFTFAAVPIVYRATDAPRASIVVRHTDGSDVSIDGDALDAATSRTLLSRAGGLDRIEVDVPRAALRAPARAGPSSIRSRGEDAPALTASDTIDLPASDTEGSRP